MESRDSAHIVFENDWIHEIQIQIFKQMHAFRRNIALNYNGSLKLLP